MDQHDPYVQRAQDGNVQQYIREIFARHNRAVHAEDERLFAELGNVLKNAPQVGQFHFRFNAVFAMRVNKYALSRNIQSDFFLLPALAFIKNLVSTR